MRIEIRIGEDATVEKEIRRRTKYGKRSKTGSRRRKLNQKRRRTVDTKLCGRRITSFLQSHPIIEPNGLTMSAVCLIRCTQNLVIITYIGLP